MPCLIYILEDDSSIVSTLEEVIHQMVGCDVKVFDQGDQLIDAVKKATLAPCLILLDVMLKVGPNGAQVARDLHNLETSARTIPVWFMTAMQKLPDLDHVKGVLTKPFDVETVVGIIKRYC